MEDPMRGTGAARIRKHPRQARLEARIPQEQKRILEHAASLRGTTLSEFIIASAQKEAVQTIKDVEMLVLCGEAREVFVNAKCITEPACS
jgi:uncharacterized protein (DUF1778 family)